MSNADSATSLDAIRARGGAVSSADLLTRYSNLVDVPRRHLGLLGEIRPAADKIGSLLARGVARCKDTDASGQEDNGERLRANKPQIEAETPPPGVCHRFPGAGGHQRPFAGADSRNPRRVLLAACLPAPTEHGRTSRSWHPAFCETALGELIRDSNVECDLTRVTAGTLTGNARSSKRPICGHAAERHTVG